jgi:Zn-dependent protease
MFTKNEVVAILISTVVIAFSVNFVTNGIIAFLWTLLATFVVIMVSVLAKKVMGFYLETETESRLWDIYWFGWKQHQHFKKPFPIGAILPLISKIILLPLKGFIWMATLVFDVKPKSYRAAKRHGLYTFSGMTEEHIGYIAAAGIVANLIFAVIGYLVGFTEFARLNIYYAFFNILPLSKLDGNKIFFGNIVLWSFLTTLTLLGLFFSIFIV